MYEALGAELFLCGTRVFSGESVFRSSGSGVAMVEGGGGEFVDVRAEAARPRAGVLDDTEVATLAQGECVRVKESSLATSRDSWETGEKKNLHGLFMRLNTPGYGMAFVDFNPSHDIRLSSHRGDM